MYRLNPFAVVSEMDDAYVLCTADKLSVRLPKRNKEFIERLTTGEALGRDELGHYVSHRRIDELVGKRLILEGTTPPLEGRYSRQQGFFSLISPDFEEHQRKIAKADVLILGAGALGGHVAWNLAAIGVGHLTIVDFDTIEETNLNRQLMYDAQDIGLLKVDVLCEKLRAFNPDIQITAINKKIRSAADIDELIGGKTALIKAIDTPVESTGWANEVCVKRGVPYVTGGFLDYIGVVGPTYIPGRSMCFDCLNSGNVKRLHGTGPTFAPLVTIVASMVSMCIYRIIVGEVEALIDKIMLYDTLSGAWQTSPITAQIECPTCHHAPAPAPVPRRAANSSVWYYRGAMLSLMCVAATILAASHDRLIGLLVFLVLVASMPALDLAVGGQPQRFRREVFVISCLYCVLNLFFASVQQIAGVRFAFAPSLAGFFGIVQQACLMVIQLVVAITVVYIVLIAFEGFLKRFSRGNEQWV